MIHGLATKREARATHSRQGAGDWLLAALLRMVLEHCAQSDSSLDSGRSAANAEAMRLLDEAGFIRIDLDAGDQICATVLPEAGLFLSGFTAE